MLSLFAGISAGFIHVLAGPDHLAAIAPIAVENRKSTWLIGFKWGLGHTAGVLIIGFLLILFKNILPIEEISSVSEKLVGFILIAIGVLGIRKAITKNLHSHEHEHNGMTHVHFHSHSPGIQHEATKSHLHKHIALGIGLIHGIAGSSHFLGVLPALALPSMLDSILYLTGFGAGTVAAMTLFSSLLGKTADKLADKGLLLYKRLLFSFCITAIVIGGFWIFI